MTTRMARVALAVGVAAVALGLGLFARGAQLEASATGTFECGSGFHGCRPWLVIRPVSWTMPTSWSPGKADGRFPVTSDGAGHWTVGGEVDGGPSRLEAGEYTLLLAVSEIDDTKPLVLGTDDDPTTGLIGTTVLCDATAGVTSAAKAVRVAAVFGPACSIEVSLRE